MGVFFFWLQIYVLITNAYYKSYNSVAIYDLDFLKKSVLPELSAPATGDRARLDWV